MTPFARLAIVGNALPRRCGIATFTADLQSALASSRPGVTASIVAMTDKDRIYDYPPTVLIDINDGRIEDYKRAADMLNTSHVEVVSLQHEFGIFGGEAGENILALTSRLTMPIVTTLHTVLARPSAKQRAVFDAIIAASARLVVMANKGRDLLQCVYGVQAETIDVIPHGIPDMPFAEPDQSKAVYGFAGRSVILTFGLLSPNKGIEVMIDAMPSVVESCPAAVYVVLGATHPNLVREHGEAYRESLVRRVNDLGMADNVVFLDQFVDQATLLGFISMCDVYVTPYLNEAQMTSGTLAYSFGMGKAVVSTPYWHAQELLADGRGTIVPFGDAAAIGEAVTQLLADETKRLAMRRRAYSISRSMTWERTAERYLDAFGKARRGHRLRLVTRGDLGVRLRENGPPPEIRLQHLLSMCDDTGLFQHAIHNVPDRHHGYCVDDNARALLLACVLNGPGEARLPEALVSRFAAFVQHAWNADFRRFRNFMSFDRRWLEPYGSEDSHGRTLWALGCCARGDPNASRRRWAEDLFRRALSTALEFKSPRAWAFMLLGLEAYCEAVADDRTALETRGILASRLMGILDRVERPGWVWFEEGLSYDNARLCQALIATGVAQGHPTQVDAGLRTLRWLVAMQTAPSGQFSPVGTEGFGSRMMAPTQFDQQPLEATATISACLAAWRADGDIGWKTEATRAFAWFLGANALSTNLVDAETGSCRDGLHADRANENRGGESVVSYLISLAEIRQMARASGDRTKPLPSLAQSV